MALLNQLIHLFNSLLDLFSSKIMWSAPYDKVNGLLLIGKPSDQFFIHSINSLNRFSNVLIALFVLPWPLNAICSSRQ